MLCQHNNIEEQKEKIKTHRKLKKNTAHNIRKLHETA